MALAPQQFCVRWNSYHTNLQTVFPKLLTTENFVDVTLACENRQIKCHKVVLSACSTYFERLLIQNPCKHPIIFMKDMRFSEMQSLVDFMYKGEVNVSQDDLPSLLKSAEALQIRGLCGSDSGPLGGVAPVSPTSATVPAPAPTSPAAERLHAPKESTPAASSPAGGSVSPSRRRSPGPGTEPRRRHGRHGHAHTQVNGLSTLKQETVEEDGLFYGEMENDDMECADQTEEDSLQTGLPGQTDFAIANVTCEYDTSRTPSPSSAPLTIVAGEDHNYNAHNLQASDCEPPAFIIKQDNPTAILSPNNTHLNQQLLAMSRKLLAASQPASGASDIAPDRVAPTTSQPSAPHRFPLHHPVSNQYLMSGVDLGNTKRIRRSEVLLKQAADCVSRGQTFQTVSDQFNIPISTIRFFMARKGILPRRKRGRSSAGHCPSPGPAPTQPPSPTQPPYHMAHYKLPDMDLGRVS